MWRPRAILFDLWGTLVPPIPPSVRDDVSRGMATDLGVDPEAFVAAYRESYQERFTGETGSLEVTIRLLAKRCGGSPSATAVAAAADRRLDLIRLLLASDAVSLATLDEVHGRGFRLGLVSDSSVETPMLWSSSPLATRMDAVAFSCLVGLRKPDPRLFLRVAGELACAAADCAYIGDGDGHELTASTALGMRAVRLLTAGDLQSDRYDDDSEFAGASVASLNALLGLPWARAR
jgi:putative hydrolase of the HAD superfamily